MATELEIKLTLSEKAQAEAFDWLMHRPGATEGAVKTLINRYYDTHDAALNRAKAALRVRHDGKRYIQTLKTQGDFVGGAHRRQEWEWELSGPDLDLSLLAQTPLHDQMDIDELTLAFETNFQRQIVMLEQGDTVIEVALDSGGIISGSTERPLHEVEFELKSGDAGALIDHALALAKVVPVFLNLVSKAEQGYFLAGIYTPSLALPSAPFSGVSLLQHLSRAWLMDQAVQVPPGLLTEVERQASDCSQRTLWRKVSDALEAGVTVPELMVRFPSLGELQLRLASVD
ncbi:CYTH domain-containing protein [Marinobacter daepoensis]|uniref:CYTH domain-containing protein n=1 Tax=Marinobacter daepoensis TaxID=262077 RepID=UPI0003FC2739|nr:CYTH domain-containing protein [Marinobacter daepoensis]